MPTAQRAREIIRNIPYITIASVDLDGQPWNAPVFAAYDKEFNFYFGTYKDSQKAINIRTNSNIFIVIYDSTSPAGTGEGVYMRAVAKELVGPGEVKVAHKLLSDRHVVPFWKLEQCSGNSPIRLYKAVPQTVWMNGEGKDNGHYIDTRVELQL
jgi:uncharacterized protein YhbP (UPF0306 family)